ncbi:rhomboid family intramembrane serine protease [Cytophagaceae bacterium ABcell3]|nr:rhomboid family intramembrane serine protease [Cytophagaceae bacterium ABcell3]
MYNLTPIVKNLLLINIGVFILASMLIGDDAIFILGLKYFESPAFQPWQFLTHMFMHAGFGHLFGNMIGLFFFGPMLERTFGSQRFLVYYLICGLGASLIYMGFVWYEIGGLQDMVQTFLIDPDPALFQSIVNEYVTGTARIEYMNLADDFRNNPDNTALIQETKRVVNRIYNSRINIPMVGASGAVFGILMGFALIFPNTELFLLFFPFPIKAKYLVFFYGLYTLYAGIQRTPGDNIAHFAHLGGMIFAFILIKYWGYRRYN